MGQVTVAVYVTAPQISVSIGNFTFVVQSYPALLYPSQRRVLTQTHIKSFNLGTLSFEGTAMVNSNRECCPYFHDPAGCPLRRGTKGMGFCSNLLNHTCSKGDGIGRRKRPQ